MNQTENSYIRWFTNLTNQNVEVVGGKNASLGEMIGTLKEEGVRVPDGFATTAEAYWQFLQHNDLKSQIKSHTEDLEAQNQSLEQVGKTIRRLFYQAEFPQEVEEAIRQAYRELSQNYDTEEVDIAARSSATAEDLPEASFAGQQETFLNVTGEKEVLEACRKCYASLFTNRAISYRKEKGFDDLDVALSVGIQKMVRSDRASAGVMFSIDTETGFPDAAIITAAWGLGENVVQGTVNPDQYTVFKPLLKDGLQPIIEKVKGSKEKKMIYATEGSETTENVDTSGKERQAFVLSDEEILQLARWAIAIESHYGNPMDMEWAKDGDTFMNYISSRRVLKPYSRKMSAGSLQTYKLKEQGEEILAGLSIGEAIASGKVCRVQSSKDIDKVKDNSILVTEMTDPDWVPIMKRCGGNSYRLRRTHLSCCNCQSRIGHPCHCGDKRRYPHPRRWNRK